ncbi:MAG: hypothetical protein ACOYK8_00730 [Alphaproteobacteria bacterium]
MNSIDNDNLSSDNEKSARKRGRVPHGDWPFVLYRYRHGDTLSAIGKDYNCTPSAIFYVIKKAEDEGVKEQKPSGFQEVTHAPVPERTTLTLANNPITESTLSLSKVEALSKVEGNKESPPPAPLVLPTATHEKETIVTNIKTEKTSVDLLLPQKIVAAAVDPVHARFEEALLRCSNAYRSWRGGDEAIIDPASVPLSDALHELRKVIARIEIEMASEKKRHEVQPPIPTPLHRSNR